jgi:1,4-alpha-glucan branching enzyme
MHSKPRRGATELGDGGAEFVLWAPSYGDITIERVDVRAEGLTEPGAPHHAHRRRHWVARGRTAAPKVFYDYEVHARDLHRRALHPGGQRPLRPRGAPRFPLRARPPGPARSDPRPSSRPALRDLLIYELHVYNFTAEDPTVRGAARGTYAGVIAKLPHLLDLGVNAIELMPVFDYSDPWQVGIRWNYITACHLFAPHRGYAPTRTTGRARSSSSSSTPATRRASR